MDWSKAKTILIVALLITNIFLVATYGTMGVKDRPEILDEEELIELMGQRGVYLETEIPKPPKSMEVIPVRVLRSVDSEVQALLASEGASELFHIKDRIPGEALLNIEDLKVADAYIEASVNFITALGFMDENVKLRGLSVVDRDHVLVEFENIYEGKHLEESTMVCSFNNGELIDLDTLWLKPTGGNKKKVSVMDPAIALLALVGDKSLEGQRIVNKIELLYWLNSDKINLEVTVADTAFPAWCITYNEGEKVYFTAAQI